MFGVEDGRMRNYCYLKFLLGADESTAEMKVNTITEVVIVNLGFP